MNKLYSLLLLAAVIAIPLAQVSANTTSEDTIVDIVVADDGEFDILQAAVIDAGLAEALSGNRQLTVFAPTDAAFEATFGADEATIIGLIEAGAVPNLTDILLYHVIPGERYSDSVLDAKQYRTLGGEKLTIEELLDAGIALPDIPAKNGVVHVIHSVLLP